MFQFSREPGLVVEELAKGLALVDVVHDISFCQLDGYILVFQWIVGLKDNPHASLANLTLDFVAAYFFRQISHLLLL